MTPPSKQDNGNVPKWLIGLAITFALSIASVGAIAIANASTLAEHKEAQKTQFQDIKDRLMRIEYKIDSNKEH